MRNLAAVLLVVAGAGVACSAERAHVFGTGGAGGAAGTGASQPSSTATSSSSTSSTTGGQGGGPVFKDGGLTGAGVGGDGACNPGPNDDRDKDGWTIAEGDCNDCDPNVNPGAIDTHHTRTDGGADLGDEDCDGKPGDRRRPATTTSRSTTPIR